jgi:hypothetical protein
MAVLVFPRSIPVAARLVLAMAAGVVVTGCSSKDSLPAGGVDCSAYSEVSSTPSCDGRLCGVANDAFCAGNTVELDCNDVPPRAEVDVCGVPLAAPKEAGAPLALERSTTVEEFAGSGDPDLGCWQPEGFPSAPEAPQMVTMEGIVKIFKNGCQSDEVQVSVYTVVRDGGADDGMPGALIGASVVTDSDCTVSGVPEDIEDCPDQRYECVFSYPDVPTETELLVKTEGSKWQTIYEYNVYFRNDEVVSGVVEKDVRALDRADYPVIAQAALGKTITPGNGSIGGEVHDCADVRLINAVVDINVPRFALSYFGNDEDDPLPDLEAKSTGVTALYTALDIAPGPATIAAAGVAKDGRLLGIGYYRTRVFPDSISTVTFRGLRPFQLPTP